MKICIIQQNGKIMNRKIVAFVQARSDSTRLPGKVLKEIIAKPMIIHQLIRTKLSHYIDEIILLTSDLESDDKLASIIELNGFNLFRGDKDNVLKRFFDCAEILNLDDNDVIVRLTGDCPLHDSMIIDESIKAFLENDCDYLANCIEPIYPDGFDVEVFSFKSLKKAFSGATKKSELEHVTPYIRNSNKFKIKNLEKEIYYPKLRLTVDEEKDFLLVKAIYEYFAKSIFSFNEIIEFLNNNKKLKESNLDIQRNEGYLKSLKEDNDK